MKNKECQVFDSKANIEIDFRTKSYELFEFQVKLYKKLSTYNTKMLLLFFLQITSTLAFTPLRILNAQSASQRSLITAPKGGVLNVQKCNKFLSPMQWTSIKYILNHYSSSEEMKNKTKKLIYHYYYNWTINKAYEFSRKYRYYKKLDPNELSLYAVIGLEKAINIYNTSYPFFNHLELYVKSSLYDAITHLQPINSIPKYYRKSKKWRTKNYKIYENSLNTQFVGPDEWIFDKYNKDFDSSLNSYKNIKIQEFIDTLDPISTKIVNLKYFQNDKWSNKKIGELLGFSEECVRLRLKKIHKDILLHLHT
jgi:RNA polymerase sigma factor (sigma-70 family)